MIGLDTNVLLRYLTADDPAQSPQARRLIDGCLSADEPLYVSLVALVETVWTLRGAYAASRSDVCDAVAALTGTDGVQLQEADAVDRAVAVSRATGADLADALIGELGRRAGCDQTATFDVAAAQKLETMALVPR